MVNRILPSLLLITWLVSCATVLSKPAFACDSGADEAPKAKGRAQR